MDKSVYRLALTHIGHNKYKGHERFSEFLVSAESEEEARSIAAAEDFVGGNDIWKNEMLSSCHKLVLGRRVISKTFLNSYDLI